jgi:hypothetical protein
LLRIGTERITVHNILHVIDRRIQPPFVELPPAQALVEVGQVSPRIFVAVALPASGSRRALRAHEVVLNPSDQCARFVTSAAVAIPIPIPISVL